MNTASGWTSRSSRSRPESTKNLRQTFRRAWLPAFPESGVQRRSAQEMGRRAFHKRPALLQHEPTRQAVPGRRRLRRLPHLAQSLKPAGRPGKSALGKPRLRDRQSIHQGGQSLCAERRERRLFLRGAGRATARHFRHFAHRDRSHQQSQRDQRHLPPRRARAHRRRPKRWPAGRSLCRARKRKWPSPTS